LPWCEDCSKFWNPPELADGAACPTCGAVVAPVTDAAPLAPVIAPALPGGKAGAAPRAKGAPWHFKLLVVGVTVYMIYRIYWLIEWLPKHI
jgi:hypothetical protein